MILNRAKDYYENNKELLRERERAKNKCRELSEEEKNIKSEYRRNRYYNMSQQNKKRLKKYQKCYREARKRFLQSKYVNKNVLQNCYCKRYFLFVLCFNNNNNKSLNVWPHLAIHKAFIILLLKRHFIF